MLIVKLVLIYVGLAGALWLLCLFLRNYLYTEPGTGLSWRVPLASGVIVVVCLGIPLFWQFRTGKSLPVTWGQFLLDTSSGEAIEFQRVLVREGGRWTEYRREGSGLGPNNFISTDRRRRFPRDAAEFVALTPDDRKIKFQAKRDKNGYFIQSNGGIVYVSEEGYQLEQVQLGRIDIARPGLRLMVVAIFLLGLAAWIGAFLLLQFNPGHAIGLGAGLYFAWLFLMCFFS